MLHRTNAIIIHHVLRQHSRFFRLAICGFLTRKVYSRPAWSAGNDEGNCSHLQPLLSQDWEANAQGRTGTKVEVVQTQNLSNLRAHDQEQIAVGESKSDPIFSTLGLFEGLFLISVVNLVILKHLLFLMVE